jgi:hypothetical protein
VGFGLRVSGFRVRNSGLELRVSDSGFEFEGCKHFPSGQGLRSRRVWSLGFRVQGSGFRVSDFPSGQGLRSRRRG